MLGLFEVIKDKFKPKLNAVAIDNWAFKLHYRVTTLLFFIATILVTFREYIGEHIKCINDMPKAGFDRVIETFCFFSTTFTVIDDFTYGPLAHPGVAPYGIGSKQPIRKHSYYQWVPFVLFGQGIMFYLTHLLWKVMEDNTIEKLVLGLNRTKLALETDEINDRQDKRIRINRIKSIFLERLKITKSWTWWFILCELLNVGNVIVQIYITQKFLGGQFYTLGTKVVTVGPQILDEVFPKVTKCSFHTYGPSGSIQIHDALCIMALNIVNEKIFVFLWFWYILLFIASCLIVFWRFLTVLFYKKCMTFNQFIFGHGKLHYWNLNLVVKQCSYHDWLLLKYLAKNMDGLVFRELFMDISEELEERKPLFMLAQGDKGTDMAKFD
ncbi:innexin inx7 [Tribolium castaneum]|uniref:Innexin n=1 Tax=Tribolium castaneum TaxID=7070 RepID=D6X4I8_TRICA|nr:PREDICTED: innexin inx7 isoform X1 [Tribolium castaneum]EEZ97262.1 Innexin inx7-like Protein [Tribolium castaneum]|eukprot:XP_968654.1 PREDICTED: innexin inx7 isoform X1 [Tribolium castaneum]